MCGSGLHKASDHRRVGDWWSWRGQLTRAARGRQAERREVIENKRLAATMSMCVTGTVLVVLVPPLRLGVGGQLQV